MGDKEEINVQRQDNNPIFPYHTHFPNFTPREIFATLHYEKNTMRRVVMGSWETSDSNHPLDIMKRFEYVFDQMVLWYDTIRVDFQIEGHDYSIDMPYSYQQLASDLLNWTSKQDNAIIRFVPKIAEAMFWKHVGEESQRQLNEKARGIKGKMGQRIADTLNDQWSAQ